MSSTPLRRVLVLGHRGLVGSALLRRLRSRADIELVSVDRSTVDLVDQSAVREYLSGAKIDEVILAAARVGGIQANASLPADFLYDNLMIECNVIEAAHRFGIQKLVFLGSSCIYPRLADQPIREDSLLTAALEPTNEAYAVAKIAGVKLCAAYRAQHGRDFRSLMPCNLYGPGDTYDPSGSHVIPALLQRFHDAAARGDTEVVVWGSGSPRREFLYVDDLAEAVERVLDLRYEEFDALTVGVPCLNVGFGSEVSIRDLAMTIARITGYAGSICWDSSKPDGTPRKLLDGSRLASIGWRPKTDLEDGLRFAYADFLQRSGSSPVPALASLHP